MSRPRYRKLVSDIWLARARMGLMIIAIAVSLTAVGAVLSARGILQREMQTNYLGTHPASATLEMSTALTHEQLAEVRKAPGVSDATVRRSVQTRLQTGDGTWHQLLLFVIAPDDPLKVSHFEVETGSWPPAVSQMLAERSTMAYFGLSDGDTVVVRGPKGHARQVTIAGTVHDAALAPSQQETLGYGYVTPALLSSLGEDSTLDDLKILVADGHQIEPVAQNIAATLAAQGVKVDRIQVPPVKAHPHQTQMNTVATLLLMFGLMAFVLSTILMAAMLGGMLAQQIRQIAVMKVVGARTSQIFGLYALMTLLIAVTATAVSVPAALWLGRLMSGFVAGLLNLDVGSFTPPAWIILSQIAAGIILPLLIASVPLARASLITVREATDDHGVVAAPRARFRLAHRRVSPSRSLSMAWRNMFRRRGRLALSLALLAAAGAVFITSLNTAAGWSELAVSGTASRHYDLEIRLDKPVSPAELTAKVLAIQGVSQAEAWLSVPAEVSKQDSSIPIARVYPDGGHGSFALVALPAATKLITPQIQSGRWLQPGDTDAVVVNQMLPNAVVGSDLTLTVNGVRQTWRIAGVVSDFGSQGSAYVNAAGGSNWANLIRVSAVSPGDPHLARQVEEALVANGYGVRAVLPVSQLAEALDGHVSVLILDLMAIALVLAVVGLLGLATSMTTSVLERTREFAIMKAVGATPAAVRRIVIGEGVLTAVLSLAIALGAALPLTLYLGSFVGRQAFALPLPFQFSGPAVLLWTTAATAGAALTCLAAAQRAARLTIREALTAI